MKIRVIVFFLFVTFSVSAQREAGILSTLEGLNFTETLPEDLLSTKSLVLLKVPDKSSEPRLRGNWKEIAETAQPGFKKAGIDAVVYYYVEDVFSGKEPVKAFAEKFADRQLSNLIFITEADDRFTIIITKITDEQKLVTAGQDAWKVTGADISSMTHQIYLKTARSVQDRKNLLILEVPMYGQMANSIEGRRGEYYDVNFSSEKLAVPAFADTAQIREAMKEYPYEYEIVDPEVEDKQLRSMGYQYVLYFVHTTGKNVKEILEYNTTETETDYITEIAGNDKPRVKSINVNTPVYKFYIKHIYSDNVFLGTKWDADTTWSAGLHNYVVNLKNELIRD